MKKKEILILCPTKSRPQKFNQLIESWRQHTSGLSDVVAIIDNNDPHKNNYTIFDDVKYLYIDPPQRVRNHHNVGFEKFKEEYNYFLILADDNLFKLTGWEEAYIKELKKTNGWGLVFSNDGYHKDFLATAPMLSTKFIKAIGWLSYPDLNYDYVDDFLQTIATDLNILHYLPEIYIEHLHPVYGKGQWDNIYLNGDPYRTIDANTFKDWKENKRESEIIRIRKEIEKINQND